MNEEALELATLAVAAFQIYGNFVVRLKDHKKASEFIALCSNLVDEHHMNNGRKPDKEVNV